MMKSVIAFIVVTLASFAAAAHPLGNFSVNQSSRIDVGRNAIDVYRTVDLAEIPTRQLLDEIDADRDGRMSDAEARDYATKIAVGQSEALKLTIDGRPLTLQNVSSSAEIRAGAGELPTLRMEFRLRTAENVETNGRVSFENENYADRLGWNEIFVTRAAGISVFDSTAFGNSPTSELESYPAENLEAPLNERTAGFSIANDKLPAGAAELRNRDGHASAAIQRDRLAELIAVPEITPLIMLTGLLIALGLGAVHAMSPGHGKTVVGAYLVGARGTVKHAAFLGLTVTITHTLGVFALGLVTLFASQYVLPEKFMPFLSFVSGLLVVYVGLSMFKSRLFSALGIAKPTHHHHHHDDEEHGTHTHDGHTHTHDGHTHSHLPPEAITWKSLLALGVSGGLLPCPSALVLMLSAISLGRVGYGLLLTITFSFGLAATLTVVGLAFLYAGRLFDGSKFAESRIARALPAFSAFVIACLGAVICYQSLA